MKPFNTHPHEGSAIWQVAGHDTTRCVVVGGGPAGMVLALLLARKGVPVVVLEAHADFDRDFRGDTIHPGVMELLDELGLAERLFELPHSKLQDVSIPTPDGPISPVEFRRLHTKFPFVTMLPQAHFLGFLAGVLQQYPHFCLRMNARVEALIEEGGIVRGVRYQGPDGTHELRALLTVGGDGRFSKVRRLAGIEPIKTSPPMDILWFRLSRHADDPVQATARFGKGHMLILLSRFDSWQIAYAIPKDSYGTLRAAGIGELRRWIVALMPEFTDRVGELDNWRQVSLLSVESSRCPRWYKPGLLLIGDAAHVMSPVGGVGINYAIQDAVEAANLLSAKLLTERLRVRDLRAVQRRREIPTRFIQGLQVLLQKRLIASALDPQQGFSIPPLLRWLLCFRRARVIPARLIGYGIWPTRLRA